MNNYVSGKSIVITGGSSGFGLEAARILLEMGAKVTITGRKRDRLNAAEADLASENLLAVQADACESDDWPRLFDAVKEQFGTVDVLVNNHGAAIKIAPVEDLSDDEIDAVLQLNLASVIKGSKQAIKVMRPNGRGHIVNVSSGCARHAWPTWGVYTAAKAGMVLFTRCLHLEMAQWGGKATSFIPGAAKTNFCAAANIDDSWQDGYPSAHDFARTLVHCIDVPDNTVIEEVNLWGTEQIPKMVVPY